MWRRWCSRTVRSTSIDRRERERVGGGRRKGGGREEGGGEEGGCVVMLVLLHTYIHACAFVYLQRTIQPYHFVHTTVHVPCMSTVKCRMLT